MDLRFGFVSWFFVEFFLNAFADRRISEYPKSRRLSRAQLLTYVYNANGFAAGE